MNTITRSFDIDVGHRLMNHEGKCKNVHGHRYTIEITCQAPQLDSVGRVIDFSAIKESVGAWLNDVFDHGFVFEKDDPIASWLAEHNQKAVMLDCPPSIENLTKVWFEGAAKILSGYWIKVVNVRGYETAKCFADFTQEYSVEEVRALMLSKQGTPAGEELSDE